MNLKVSFSWVGLVVFALPMLINLAYAAFPPAGKAGPPTPVTRWVALVEQSSRIAYLLAVMLLVSREPVRPQGVWFWLAVCFLALYYAVWIRYFLGGREIALLQRAFLLVPLPLVFFPVLYYLCAVAAESAGGDPDADLRRGTSDSIDPVVFCAGRVKKFLFAASALLTRLLRPRIMFDIHRMICIE